MCFSATASFGAAIVLGIGGLVALKKVKKPRQIMFAAMPLIFAFQQACEGLVWVSLKQDPPGRWLMPASYGFLFFAQILWTTWMPLSFLLLEKHKIRQRFLAGVCLLGVTASVLLAYRLVIYNVFPEIESHHIRYIIESPQFIITDSSILYVIVIVLPPFLSGIKHIKWIGLLVTASLILAKVVYANYLISVWCFFAALISLGIILVMNQFQKENHAITKPEGL